MGSEDRLLDCETDGPEVNRLDYGFDDQYMDVCLNSQDDGLVIGCVSASLDGAAAGVPFCLLALSPVNSGGHMVAVSSGSEGAYLI